LLINGQAIRFYSDRANPATTIVADFIIFHKNKEMLLHLFLRRENENTNQFAPISFIVKSLNEKYSDQYILRQEHNVITQFSILENLKTDDENLIETF
jgi:hypothetical protein